MNISLQQTTNDMRAELLRHGCQQFDQIPWIISKVIRITMAQYHLIAWLTEAEHKRCLEAAKRLAAGETVASIFGELEFYGNFFKVMPDVFYPRLTTHALIDTIRHATSTYPHLSAKQNLSILDLCTGTGCIAVTLAKLLDANVVGADISAQAISLASRNREALGAKNCTFIAMDIMKPWQQALSNKFDIIVSNPPYWTMDEILSKSDAIRNNPLNAFLGGINGIEFHQTIIGNAPNFLKPNGMLCLEMEPNQEQRLRKLLAQQFDNIEVACDYLGSNRVIYGTCKQ